MQPTHEVLVVSVTGGFEAIPPPIRLAIGVK
jgi:hypothetical protein